MANIFPQWSNQVPWKLVVALLLLGATVVTAVTYYATPKYTRVGYAPTQPVAFSHAIHVDQVGMDCRYCHTSVTKSEHSMVPSTQTCMNCHSQIQTQSEKLAPIRESYASGRPVNWVRIHKTPDYVFFNHAAHVNRGVSCVHCHGRVDQMEVVSHAEPLSMGFCLDCHRNPEEFIRPNEEVFNLAWEADSPQQQRELGTRLAHDWRVNPPQSCSGCHR